MSPRTLLVLVVAALSGCSYTFDSSAPLLTVSGDVPDTAGQPRLNTWPALGETYVRGFDHRIWIVIQQSDNSWHMQALSGAPDTDDISPDEADDVFPVWRALYITKKMKATPGATTPSPVMLTVRSAGEHPGHTFTMPGGAAVLFSGGADDVFAYIITDGNQPGYYLQRRDESFSRIVPWPKGVTANDPFRNGAYWFDNDTGDTFFDRDADGRVVAHSTRDNGDVDLGIRPRFFNWLDDKTWVTCGNDGVRIVHVDGRTPESVLDDTPCKQERLNLMNGYAYYDVGTTIRKVKLDGSEPPAEVFDFGTNRVLILTDHDDVFYSTDPSDRYARAAGDGWLEGAKFMQRGTQLQLSGDRKHLWWVEDSAQNGGAGQLTSLVLPGAAMPGGTPEVLTRNTRQYSILGDGRILCDENHAFNGTFNRIVVIDEKSGTKRWVAAGANRFGQIPFTNNELTVDVVTGATGHDIVRAKVPPLEGPPP